MDLIDVMLFLLGILSVVSPIIWVYWQFHPESPRNQRLEYAVLCGTFGAAVLLSLGFNSLLFVVPSGEGRSILAVVLGFLFWVGFLFVSNRLKELQVQKRDSERLAEAQNRTAASDLQQEKRD